MKKIFAAAVSVFAFAALSEAAFAEAALAAGCPVTRIGLLQAGNAGLTILAADGQPLALNRLGYDHLA
ncbi:MAG: hypothetical protein HC850_07820 [Rhodomicrobium sp.]|nr:hypothetical protein [Rhodomicrobium sp.]